MMEEIKNKIDEEIVMISTKRKKNNCMLLKLIQRACRKIQEKVEVGG